MTSQLTSRPSLAAEVKFRQRLAELGAELLEPEWLGTKRPHHVICVAGHDCHPHPGSVIRGQGVCRICCGLDSAVAEAAFRARLAELGAELLEPYHGSLAPHRVRCACGRISGPAPHDVVRGKGICHACAGLDKATAETAFLAALAKAGSVALGPYLGNKHHVRVRCVAGHENKVRPDVVLRGHRVCRDCAYRTWDVFYVIQHESEPRIKFGITNLTGKHRLRTHRRYGYTNVLRLVTGLPGGVAKDAEDAVRAALRDAGEKPVKGREHFDVDCLALVLDVADSWLADIALRRTKMWHPCEHGRLNPKERNADDRCTGRRSCRRDRAGQVDDRRRYDAGRGRAEGPRVRGLPAGPS